MKLKLSKIFLVFTILNVILVIGFVFWAAQVILAQDFEAQQQEVLNQQTQLQNQLRELEAQIKQYQVDLKDIQGQKKTLQNKISELSTQAATLNLQLKATNLQLDDLDLRLNSTQMDIQKNQERNEAIKTEMAEILNLIYQNDNYSLFYTLFRQSGFTEIFTEIENANQIINNLSVLLEQNKAVKNQLAASEELLNEQIEESQSLKNIQILQMQDLAFKQNSQKVLLQETKGQESLYQQDLTDAQKQVKEIKNRIYSLLEVQKQINFGQAVTIAQWAGSQTGVRAAFLLAVLSQESSLGKNVGTCNRAGDPPSKSYKVVMKPTRDIEPFLAITQALGLNPDTTPISCPMRDKQGNQIGWGGAMGPAQFIPSTWQGYASKVTAITGKTANPWDIRDAFLAAAIKLGHDGATSQSGEWAAAMRYFSGSTNPAYSFYGDSVISKAEQYQADIDQISK